MTLRSQPLYSVPWPCCKAVEFRLCLERVLATLPLHPARAQWPNHTAKRARDEEAPLAAKERRAPPPPPPLPRIVGHTRAEGSRAAEHWPAQRNMRDYADCEMYTREPQVTHLGSTGMG